MLELLLTSLLVLIGSNQGKSVTTSQNIDTTLITTTTTITIIIILACKSLKSLSGFFQDLLLGHNYNQLVIECSLAVLGSMVPLIIEKLEVSKFFNTPRGY